MLYNVGKSPQKCVMTSARKNHIIPKVFIGNLPNYTSKNSLKKLFNDFKIPYLNITMHRRYAFVNIPDQLSIDKAINMLNGYTFHGSSLVVEPSVKKNDSCNCLRDVQVAQSKKKPGFTQNSTMKLNTKNRSPKVGSSSASAYNTSSRSESWL